MINTDRELWNSDYYDGEAYQPAFRIHITENGALGISVYGQVIVMPVKTWHTLGQQMMAVNSRDMGATLPIALTDQDVTKLEAAIRAEGYDIHTDTDTGAIELVLTRVGGLDRSANPWWRPTPTRRTPC